MAARVAPAGTRAHPVRCRRRPRWLKRDSDVESGEVGGAASGLNQLRPVSRGFSDNERDRDAFDRDADSRSFGAFDDGDDVRQPFECLEGFGWFWGRDDDGQVGGCIRPSSNIAGYLAAQWFGDPLEQRSGLVQQQPSPRAWLLLLEALEKTALGYRPDPSSLL